MANNTGPIQSITFALYTIEQFFPENYEPGDLITMDDETLHKLAKPLTGRKLRGLLQVYRSLKEELDTLRAGS